MRHALLFLLLLSARIVYSQPLSGSYTVGGASPSFPTLQAAANALKARGVSGPVTLNIRPGIYMENNGASRVMLVDSIIAGLSSSNRITFQPDAGAGGNVDNVVLQVDQSVQNGVAAVEVKVDFLTLRNLSFRDADSAQAGAEFLLRVTRYFPSNLTIEGLIVEGCKFIGNPINTDSSNMGTDYGIFGDLYVNDALIRGNTFSRLFRSVSIGSGTQTARIVIEDNTLFACHSGRLAFGTGIYVQARNAIVRRNIIDNTGSRGAEEGINVAADTGLVERNHVKNNGRPTGVLGENYDFDAIVVNGAGSIDARSMMVVNNMISGNYSGGGGRRGIRVLTKHARIIHNTIVHPARQQISTGIRLETGTDSCTVLNNILMDFAPTIIGLVAPLVAFDQTGGVNGLISDYNVFSLSDTGGVLVKRGSTLYRRMDEYRIATGLDSHTITKNVDFVAGISISIFRFARDKIPA